MPTKIKTQKDYLVTEVQMSLPCDLNELGHLFKATRATGRIVAVYCDGGVIGINVEQRTKVGEPVSQRVRDLVGVSNKEITPIKSL
jgi:hypothetical protein